MFGTGGVKCRVTLNEPDWIYFPGDSLEGHIELNVKRDVHIENITAILIGTTSSYNILIILQDKLM